MEKIFLTEDVFLQKVKKLNDKYWNSVYNIRWEYMSDVIEELKIINPETAIEIGTAKISLMNFSDSMDICAEMIDPDNISNRVFIDDSRITPWKIEDKYYDVFVGLQVLEHLSPNQFEVFQEIKRISKYCILTLPYMWKCKDENDCHHMITIEKINEWTDNEIPYETKIINNRIMLCYKF